MWEWPGIGSQSPERVMMASTLSGESDPVGISKASWMVRSNTRSHRMSRVKGIST